MIQQNLGLRLDQVSTANAKGGTSNDGNQARQFFSTKSKDVIIDCICEKYKPVIASLHINLSVILRVVSGTKK